jgi:hypothetical protein
MPTEQRVTVRAIKPFDYLGRRVEAGEILSIPPLAAILEHRKGHVSLARITSRDMQPAAVGPEAEPIDTPRPKRRYRRRDLTAEE